MTKSCFKSTNFSFRISFKISSGCCECNLSDAGDKNPAGVRAGRHSREPSPMLGHVLTLNWRENLLFK